MRHHNYGTDFDFVVPPVKFNKYTEKSLLQYCLGATLYMPGTKKIVNKILEKQLPGLTSMVMCFEDAIQEKDLSAAESNVLEHLAVISKALKEEIICHDDIPLTFLRVRTVDQFESFVKRLTHDTADVLTGFVFPKFYSENAFKYYDILTRLNRELNVNLYAMPILEGTQIAYLETRLDELKKLQLVFRSYPQQTLNIRIGGTDFSSIFGMRRGINYSVYDILPVRDCLSDILNFFNRQDDDFIISAPVWEYFLADKKENLADRLGEDIHRSLLKRHTIVNEAIDGLMREVILDKANGFVGKTIIHPSHLRYVNAMQAATREEYEDSCQILQTEGGVVKGTNKMNEINPHRNWALKIANRAKAFGVIENEASYYRMF
ncbi:MAG: HpcH/HpaI aldolase/citrate lyase family protein [Spirochaetes bacterium]|nr:HpcH/HpaI aldolase/citrate lyase family protein [Spirochaetota bacterium]